MTACLQETCDPCRKRSDTGAEEDSRITLMRYTSGESQNHNCLREENGRDGEGMFDADRDEDEVFYDISMAVDSKLFPNKEAAAGEKSIQDAVVLFPAQRHSSPAPYPPPAPRMPQGIHHSYDYTIKYMNVR
ncbi:hypothetical protein CB1_000940010 [Camelus ferus]|nr:hypothetical protein CB1_000940010 [Camelus ferus]